MCLPSVCTLHGQLGKWGHLKESAQVIRAHARLSTWLSSDQFSLLFLGESANGVTPKLLQTHQLQPRTPASR